MSAPGNGRVTARPTAEAPAQRATGRVEASLERLAEHLVGAATAVRDLARDLGDVLDDSRNPRLMDPMPTPAPGTDELLTVADIAARLSVSDKTVRNWRSAGILPEPIGIGGVIRWRPETFEQWLQEQGS